MKLNNFFASMLFRKFDDDWKLDAKHHSAEYSTIMPTADFTQFQSDTLRLKIVNIKSSLTFT